MHIFRHLAQKSLDIRQYACGISIQSDEKSVGASSAQVLCGVAFNHCANRKGVVYHRFIDYGKFTLNGCTTPPIQIKPKQVEDTVLKEMRKRIEQLHIEKHEASLMPKRRAFALIARYRSSWKSSQMPTAFSLTTYKSM